MSLESAFDTLQQNVNVPAQHDKRARERRDVFKRAFSPSSRADVMRVFASGSLAESLHPLPKNLLQMGLGPTSSMGRASAEAVGTTYGYHGPGVATAPSPTSASHRTTAPHRYSPAVRNASP